MYGSPMHHVLKKRYTFRVCAMQLKISDRLHDREPVAKLPQQVIAAVGEAGLRYYAYDDLAVREGQNLYVKEALLLIVLNL